MLSLTALMIFMRKRRLTQRCGPKGMRASGREEARQQVADVILAAEKDRKDAYRLFSFVHIEPADSPVDCQQLQTRQQIVVTLPAMRRRTPPVGDLADPILAIIQRRLNACFEAAVILKQVAEDQGKITLGFRLKLNSEPHVHGASW